MMGNKSATLQWRRFAGVRLTSLGLVAGALLALAGAGWMAKTLTDLSQREIVTVRLAALMGEFVEAEARSGASPEVSRERIARYLAAVDTAVRQMGTDGRTVLVAEAVVAGSAHDVTPELRAAVTRILHKPVVGPDPASIRQAAQRP